jgi:hypothetical protein
MSAPKDGGSAFPTMKSAYQLQSGMTLRDWFAGMALQGEVGAWTAPIDGNEQTIAERCYRLSDAMLAAREGKEEGQ